MKRSRFLLILFSLFILGITLVFSFYSWNLVERKVMSIDLGIVEGASGFNADTDALHFGKVSKGGKSTRQVTIEPIRDGRLRITVDGVVAPWIAVDKNDLQLSKGEPVTLSFVAQIPLDAELGEYSGEAVFSIYKI